MTKMILHIDAFDGIRERAKRMRDWESLNKIIDAEVVGMTGLFAWWQRISRGWKV
jgi:hypothetical protein